MGINRISGLVCGVSVDYEIRGAKNGVQLIGSGRPVYLEVSNEAGGRRITGALGNRTGVNEVDLFVTDGSLKGRAGVRRFDLRANGDDLVGPMTALNTLGSVEALVAGRGELAKLPDAELGAIVPTLLNCSAPMSRSIARQGIAVRIGGPAGYDTRYSNEIGRAN